MEIRGNRLDRYRELAEKAVAGSEADFVEISIHKQERSSVVQSGIIGENTGPVGRLSGTARAFVSNRWGICEFHNMETMPEAVDRAAAQAIHSSSPPVPFPMLSEDSRDTFNDTGVGVSPGEVPLREKAFLCRHYCELLGASVTNGSARVSYDQHTGDRVTVNSRGTSVREMENLCSIRLEAVLPGGRLSLKEIGVRGTFDPFRGLEKEITEAGKNLLLRDTSTAIAPGVSRVVLDPELTGILVHEAFGHLVEADFLEANPAVAHLMRRGTRIASPLVNIVDDTGLFTLPGSMKWDFEGNPGGKTILVKNGVMESWLHTSGTAAGNGVLPTGNARVPDPGRSPEARMTCTYMEPGQTSFDDIINHLGNGLFLKGFMGGATDMDRFSIAVQEVWTVRNGALHKPVSPVVISGRVTDILDAVDETGNELRMTGVLRGCSRMGSSPIPVSYGGPHVLIREVQVS